MTALNPKKCMQRLTSETGSSCRLDQVQRGTGLGAVMGLTSGWLAWMRAQAGSTFKPCFYRNYRQHV